MYPVTGTNHQQVLGKIPSDELQGTATNQVPAIATPDSSMESTAPAVTSTFPLFIAMSLRLKEQQIRCMSHHAFILKRQFQITTFIRELKSHKEGLQLSKKRIRKSSSQIY